MTGERFHISRRKALAALETIDADSSGTRGTPAGAEHRDDAVPVDDPDGSSDDGGGDSSGRTGGDDGESRSSDEPAAR